MVTTIEPAKAVISSRFPDILHEPLAVQIALGNEDEDDDEYESGTWHNLVLVLVLLLVLDNDVSGTIS
jgi:hypothetical protein